MRRSALSDTRIRWGHQRDGRRGEHNTGHQCLETTRTFTASELASFLNLTQQFFDRPTKTFADAGERALAVPEFTGQIGTQRDNGSIWVSDGVAAGDWEYFDNAPDAGSVVTSMLASGILSADGDGRAKMADGYVTLTKIASGILRPIAPVGEIRRWIRESESLCG